MAKTFRAYAPEQDLLLPPSLSDWLPDGHLARFVGDLMDELDLREIEDVYREERGFPPYHPRMMTKVLLYAYATGTYSSRRMAGKLADSVAFRYLAAGNQPDFRTISNFRKRHGQALAGLFKQVLLLCQRAGLVKLGRVAVDGTKLKANASKHKAMSYSRMEEKEAALAAEVAQMLKRADEVDREEDRRYGSDRRGDELPEELARRESRLAKIRAAKAALEAEARERAKKEGKDPDIAKPEPNAQRNFTDPESKIQKTSDGFIQGYNGQIAVDGASQVIVAQHVTPASSDAHELVPAIDAIERTLGDKPKQILADAGYWSELNVAEMNARAIDPYIATRRIKHSEPRVPASSEPMAEGLTLKQRMEHKLNTAEGGAVYALRKTIPEPVFGLIKQARGFRQFLRRGITKVSQDWALVCTAHNLLKLYGAWAQA